MKRTTKYVALDIHQATTVTTVREQSGRVIARGILPTEAGALVAFFGSMRGSVHVAFEEGTQAQWLHDLLAPVVHRIMVCDRRGEHRGNKADQLMPTNSHTGCSRVTCERSTMAAVIGSRFRSLRART